MITFIFEMIHGMNKYVVRIQDLREMSAPIVNDKEIKLAQNGLRQKPSHPLLIQLLSLFRVYLLLVR